MISPEALEKARGLVANYGSDPDGLLVGAVAAALQAERDAAASKVDVFIGQCPNCNSWFVKTMRQVRYNNINRNKKGPFCSKSCASSGRLPQRKREKS